MSTARTTLMHQEAAEAGAAVARQFAANASTIAALADALRSQPPAFIATSARGSSDHAATYGKHLFETLLGLATASVPPSVSSLYGARLRLDGALHLAISQSGRSPDLLRQAEAARAGGARVVALVNDADSPLAALADTVLPLHAGPERSVAATKSYLCSLAALLQLAAHWSQDARLLAALDHLPGLLDEAFAQDWSSLAEGLADGRNLFVLGRGPGLGAAQEIALKLKETCGIHAEAFSSAEVRHGPMTLVGPGFPLLVLTQDDASHPGNVDAAREFAARGARVWTAGAEAGTALPGRRDVHPLLAPLLAVSSFYRAVNALALARGRDPDQPPHLNKVTETV